MRVNVLGTLKYMITNINFGRLLLQLLVSVLKNVHIDCLVNATFNVLY